MTDGTTAHQLVGRTWRVARIDGVPSLPDWPATLTFGHDGTLTGCASVNRLSGAFTIAGSLVEIGPLATTLMAGPPEAMDQEQALVRVLSGPLTVSAREAGSVLLESTQAPAQGHAARAGEPGGSILLVDASEVVHVTGAVVYRQRIALLPEAVTTVIVQDIARADAPAIVLASCTIEGGQVPIPFDLSFPSDRASASARLSVSARIECHGQLLWISDTVVPVGAEGLTAVEVLVVPVPHSGSRVVHDLA